MPSSTSKPTQNQLAVVHPHAAGIDIGSRQHYVAVDPGLPEPSVRTFGCSTPDLLEMGRWLKACGVTTIAMESTGVYWVPVARLLEDVFDFEVRLVDPHHVRNVPGRKTDVKDCQWLRQLHSYGLLSGVFRATPELAPLKAYHRHRKSLVEACSQQVHRMQKALEVMNVQLHKVLTDITGVTGMAILRAIVAGERDPVALARHRHPMVHSSTEQIAKALSGNFLSEQVFTLRQALESYDFIHRQLRDCDAQIKAYMASLSSRPGPDTDRTKPPKPSRRKNQPHFDLRSEMTRICGVDLTRIPGVDQMTAYTVISEVGIDVTAFPTEKHFASWLTLCPNHAITGGRIRRRKTRPGASRVAAALRVAAQTLHKAKTAMGALYRRLRARLGAPKAITAVARRLAVLIYRMLKHGEAFVEKGQDWYETQYRVRAVANLKRSAKNLGFDLLPVQAPPPDVS
jgi:transposase